MTSEHGIPYQPDANNVPLHAHRLDVQPSPYDPRDFIDNPPMAAVKLPDMFMINKRPPHRQQGQQGSCTGNGTAYQMDTQYLTLGLTILMRSAAMIYILERDREGTSGEDSGAFPIDAMRVGKHYGVASDALMPYSDTSFTTQPDAAALADGLKHVFASYARPASMHAIMLSITKGIPVGVAFNVYQGMEVSRNGVIPMPAAGEQPKGGHWSTYDGYCFRPDWPGGGYFRVGNTWGEEAGDHGDYYMPFAMYANRSIVFETRTFKLAPVAA